MKKILVTFACAAGMLLMLSSSCDDNDFTSGGGGSKGASGLERLPSPYPCSTGGGTGDIDIYKWWYENCSTSDTYTPARGACVQVTGGFVVISFDRDEASSSHRVGELSIQFFIPEEDFAVDTFDLDAGEAEAVFRGKQTGKREDLFDSEICPRCTGKYITIDAINQATPGSWTSGDTIDISWNAAAGAVEKDGVTCDDDDTLASDSGGNGGYNGIPYM